MEDNENTKDNNVNNENIKPPINRADYKESLKNVSREELIASLMKSGKISYEDASEFADEVDEDRKAFGLE